MNSNQINRIFGLDLIRAVAILLVVMSHATLLLFPYSEHAIVILIKILGVIGVDLFFVLSGFLIGGILLKQIDQNKTRLSDLFRFWKRR
ncbi:acyltransferase [Lutibacter sp.]|uniref:acyltransferase family protein n=1 Tax=Lutibacter sp. TaxID=1925666 RepID=UPI002732D468|nr:acyltransferase family protein [Lutibacter sp.]MDP3311908.1 acyltransferase family protein [Lutibacter sp.]